ncbi:DUF3558 family protein [Actinokineospora soli]|uniref:DUF3558 family protein n=1 Tax=Actinokineospora soli TaxID=1048753 RepID=A0ABW2TVC6_9PSEU
MRWAVVAVVCLAAACKEPNVAPPPSGPSTTVPTVPPAVSEPMGVEALAAVDPCALVDEGLRRELRVAVEGYGYTEDGARTCRWEENGQAGIGLGVRVELGEDPLVEVYARGGCGSRRSGASRRRWSRRTRHTSATSS